MWQSHDRIGRYLEGDRSSMMRVLNRRHMIDPVKQLADRHKGEIARWQALGATLNRLEETKGFQPIFRKYKCVL